MFHMKLCRFRRMVPGMLRMSVSGMCVVGGGFVIAILVMSCGMAMMLRRALVVLRCLLVMLGCFSRHFSSQPRSIRLAGCTLVLPCYS